MTTVEAAPAAKTSDERLAHRGPLQKLLVSPEIGALVGLIGIWTVFWAISVGDVFGTAAGTATYLDGAAAVGIMAVAVALLMIGGEFDLSAGALTGATGMLVILFAKEAGEFGGAGLPLALAIPLTLAFALGIGFFNGNVVERTNLPSFIVTLGAFFMLIGAKLGFAKLFTDKVIVEGLDQGSGYDTFRPIFAYEWIRNEHVWESKDAAFLVLALVGGLLVMIGFFELTYVRRDEQNPSGYLWFAGGLAGVIGGIAILHLTDSTLGNYAGALVCFVTGVAAATGFATARYEQDDRLGGLEFDSAMIRFIGIGIAALVVAIIAAFALESESEDIVGFLLTEQGLRGIAFVVLAGVGLVALSLAATRAPTPSTRLFMLVIVALAVVVFAFVIRAESESRKFRVELFSVMLIAAAVIVASAVVAALFKERSVQDRSADRLGRLAVTSGLIAAAIGLLIKLLYMTAEEVERTPGVIRFRISIVWMLGVAIFGAWLLAKTKFGNWIFAVGGNKVAARSVGVPAARVKTTLFLMVSGAAWLVGMIRAFRFNSVQADVGNGEEFFYIIAAVVGGNLLTGGYGSAVGAAFGALIIAMSRQGITNAGFNSNWVFLFLGAILLVAVLVNNFVRTKAEASRK